MKKIQLTVLMVLLCTSVTLATEYWAWDGGNWATTSTWAYWNGSAWVTATALPAAADGVQLMNCSNANPITLAAGNTATIDYLYMGSGWTGDTDALNIYGTLDVNNGSGYNGTYFGNWSGGYDADATITVYSGATFDPGAVTIANTHTSAVNTIVNAGGMIAYVTAVSLNTSKLAFVLNGGETYISATSISGATSSKLTLSLDNDALLVLNSTLLTNLINAGCIIADGTTVNASNRSTLLDEDATYSPWVYVSLAGGSAPGAASTPSPANSAMSVSVTTDLSWTAGSGATSHNVYFGTSSPGTSRGNQTTTTYDTGTMANSTTYYWRIDEVNAYGTTTGMVWSFTTEAANPPAAAFTPAPANGATNVAVTTDLGWTAGSGATSHNIYFGTSSPGAYQGNQANTSFDTGTMVNSTTYYWRIDEVNAYGTTTGTVWNFTTVAAAPARLAVSVDKHYLTYNNQPIMLVGDSLTQGWMECGFTSTETSNYIDALASRGINVLMLWTFIASSDASQTSDNRIGYNSPERWPWQKSGGLFNLGAFNQTYFDDLAALVVHAQSHNIMVLITIQDGWTKDRWANHPFNSANGGPVSANSDYVTFLNYNAEMSSPGTDWRQKNQYYQEQFCIKLVQTVGSYPNVMFEISNEGEWYNQANYRAYNVHLADVVKDRTDALVLVNDDHVGGTNFRSEPDCDVVSLHKPQWSTSTKAYDFFSAFGTEYWATPAKPQFFSEPVPEWQGDSSTIESLMRVMWGTVLGMGGYVCQNDTSFGWDPSCLMAAEAADRDIMYDRIGHCARFFNTMGVNWSAMGPYYYAAGQGSSYSSCMGGGNQTVSYFQAPTSSSAWVYIGPNATRNYRFYNPYWGYLETSGQVTADANGYATFTLPYVTYDSVLHTY